jgi:alpha-L-fucosidase
MLIEVVSKGGNLLLNIGPRPDGTIQPEFVSRLEAMGAWMKVNSESIYGTKASPFTALPFFGRATQKGNTLYLHVFEWPRDHRLRVPELSNRIVSAHLLADPSARLTISKSWEGTFITLPAPAPDDIASVVALELDSPAHAGDTNIHAGPDGTLRLPVESSEIQTDFEQRAKLENALHHVFLTSWSKPQDVPYWNVRLAKGGKYRVDISYAATKPAAGAAYTVTDGPSSLSAKVAHTQGEWVFGHESIGEIELPAGVSQVKVQIAGKSGQDVMQLEGLTLTYLSPVENHAALVHFGQSKPR